MTLKRRTQWLTWHGSLTRERVQERYREEFGRAPNRIYSPEESATSFWWTGWVGAWEVKPSAWRVNK